MADKIITELQLISAVDENLSIPVDDGSQTYRMTTPQLLAWFATTFSTVMEWSNARTYTSTQFVLYSGKMYKSLQGSNLNKTPSSEAAWWIDYGDYVIQNNTPAGVIEAFGGTSAPTGYLLCNGSAISRSTYSKLFTAIGTAFGAGDGSTTFNIPDFRGTFLRGLDGSKGLDPDKTGRTAMATGGNTGNNVGSIQPDDYDLHTHRTVHSSSGGTLVSSSGHSVARQGTIGGAGDDEYQLAQGSADPNICNASTSGGNETRPVNAYVNYIIKT